MEEKEYKMKLQAIIDLAKKTKDIINTIQKLKEDEQILKEELRGLMKELNIRIIDSMTTEMEGLTQIKIDYPKSINAIQLKLEFPELAEMFVKEEIKYRVDNKDKNRIKKEFPSAWNACKIELTPRITIK